MQTDSGPQPQSPKAPTDAEAEAGAAKVGALRTALGEVVVGQSAALHDVFVGLLADGHVLLEGVPGVGKTLLARTLAKALSLEFKRVQFTPDLMPADLLGTRIWNEKTRDWELHKGPVFTDVLLADEINRTPPKTQAALLEAMDERQVTLDGERHDLGDAFFVIATSNPLEFEGTYPLPEAQTDRFLLKISLGYPSEEAELALLEQGGMRTGDRVETLSTRLSREELVTLRGQTARVRVDDVVRRYVISLLQATRQSDLLKIGASPRAGLMLLGAAQAAALMAGRSFVLPDDVKAVAPPVLRHRLHLSTDAELDGLAADEVLSGLLEQVAIVAQK